MFPYLALFPPVPPKNVALSPTLKLLFSKSTGRELSLHKLLF